MLCGAAYYAGFYAMQAAGAGSGWTRKLTFIVMTKVTLANKPESLKKGTAPQANVPCKCIVSGKHFPAALALEGLVAGVRLFVSLEVVAAGEAGVALLAAVWAVACMASEVRLEVVVPAERLLAGRERAGVDGVHGRGDRVTAVVADLSRPCRVFHDKLEGRDRDGHCFRRLGDATRKIEEEVCVAVVLGMRKRLHVPQHVGVCREGRALREKAQLLLARLEDDWEGVASLAQRHGCNVYWRRLVNNDVVLAAISLMVRLLLPAGRGSERRVLWDVVEVVPREKQRCRRRRQRRWRRRCCWRCFDKFVADVPVKVQLLPGLADGRVR